MKSLKILVALLLVVQFSSCSKQSFSVTPQDSTFGGGAKYNSKVDVLWVVDTSSSMAKHQQNIASKADDFMRELISLKLDFRLAMTTMDMSGSGMQGRLVGTSTKIITNKTPNAVSVFQNLILQGESGSNLERGLEAMQALMEREEGPSSEGFLRSDSLLVVIFLTDEDDFSAGSANDYINFLNEKRPPLSSGERSWLAHFIGVTEPNNSACTTRNSFSDPGDRYMELVAASEGVSTTICTDDFTEALTNVRARIVQYLTDFKLDQNPLVETIKVFVNGEEVPQDAVNGWTYEANKNVVRFHGTSIPGADDLVKITFTPTTE